MMFLYNKIKLLSVTITYWVLFVVLLPQGLVAQQIKTAHNDQRLYKLINLDNGLQVLLISDPNTSKSAASMNIDVGSYYDQEVQGLAHFLEHMLFLGTAKYPDEGQYFQFISQHNGAANAFTGSTYTNYFFDIDPLSFNTALDMFGQFFIAPLFNQEFVDRELNAVEAEHSRNLSNDFRKAYEVKKIIFDQNYPASKFHTGNKDTLESHPDLRQKLVQFYDRYYVASNMSLALIDNKPLSEMESIAKQIFSQVRSQARHPDPWDKSKIFNKELLGSLISVQTIQDNRNLSLSFIMPSLKEAYNQKPDAYLASLFGDETQGSILEQLKQKQLAIGLWAGFSNEKDYSLFNINIELTPQGAKNLPLIISTVFDYARLVAKEGISLSIYQEMQKIAQLNFDYKGKEDPSRYVVEASRNIRTYPMEQLLSGGYLFADYDAALLKRLVALINPHNFYAVFSSPDVQGDMVEPWYGSKYNITKFTDEQVKQYFNQQSDFALQLPAPNNFLPQDLNVYSDTEPQKPTLIINNEKIDFWFNKNANIDLPKSILWVRFLLPYANQSVAQSAMSEILQKVWQESLNARLYPARLLGINYSINATPKGLEIYVDGYSDSIDNLLKDIVNDLLELEISPQLFAAKKEEVWRAYQNMQLQDAMQKGFQQALYLLVDPKWPLSNYLQVLPNITVDDLNDFKTQLLLKGKVLAYLHGSFSQEEALALATDLQDMLPIQPLFLAELPQIAISQFPVGASIVADESINDDSALLVFFQSMKRSVRNRAALQVLEKFMQQAFFHQLRTIEQLGYLVQSAIFSIAEHDFFYFAVQSPTADSQYLDERLQSFLIDFYKQLQELDPAYVQAAIEAIINELSQPPQSLGRWADKYWSDIRLEKFDFPLDTQLIAELQTLNLEDIILTFQQLIFEDPRVLRVMVQGEKQPAIDFSNLTGDQRFIDDPILFKRTLNRLSTISTP